MAQARAVLAAWRQDYNTIRPHSKLGRLTPAEIAGQRGWGMPQGNRLKLAGIPKFIFR
jgi:hypothetical protein